jgi:hypothetical protein
MKLPLIVPRFQTADASVKDESEESLLVGAAIKTTVARSKESKHERFSRSHMFYIFLNIGLTGAFIASYLILAPPHALTDKECAKHLSSYCK